MFLMRSLRTLILIATLVACTVPAQTAPSANVAVSPTATLATATTTPTPTTSAPPTQVPSPSATSADPSRYGYIFVSPGRIVVRGERATDTPLAIGGDVPAASHDGKRIAFWRTGPQGNNPQELRVVDVATGAERMLTSIPIGQGGGAIAWANDDTGLLYETHSTAEPPPGPPTAPPSQLFSYDLVASANTIATDPALRNSGGLVFIPLAWDKAAGIAAALTTGEGGYAVEYIVWDKGARTVKKTQFPWRLLYGAVQPSPEGTMMLASEFDRSGLRFWPLADIGNAQRLTPAPDAAGKSVGASWRPGARGDFAWVTASSVSLYTYGTDRPPRVLARAQDIAIVGWRADGSGILLTQFGGGISLVDLATLQVTPLPHLAPVGAAQSLGPPVGAVLLR